MRRPPPAWRLVDFTERLDLWISQEPTNVDLRFVVTEWVLSRADDPYQGVNREPGFPNLWYGVIPRTGHGTGQVVACSYWIKEQDHVVQCNLISTLNWPA